MTRNQKQLIQQFNNNAIKKAPLIISISGALFLYLNNLFLHDLFYNIIAKGKYHQRYQQYKTNYLRPLQELIT